MQKAYRICWLAVKEDEILLEGRSLVYGTSLEEVFQLLRFKKCKEYGLRQEWFKISSIVEMKHLNTEETN